MFLLTTLLLNQCWRFLKPTSQDYEKDTAGTRLHDEISGVQKNVAAGVDHRNRSIVNTISMGST